MSVAVVVGNGESLRVTPLEKIKYPCFAVNRIHKIYPLTSWRPTYYVRVEPVELERDSEEAVEAFREECRLHVRLGEQCTFPKIWREWLGEHPNVTYRNTCRHFSRKRIPGGWHLPMLCDYGTVVTAAIQDAVIRGFTEIILVGCDLTGEHFTPDYGKAAIQTELWRTAHEIAGREAEANGIKIYNATTGGSLEIYPRVNLEAYLLDRQRQELTRDPA
jgi:hypothetical protein